MTVHDDHHDGTGVPSELNECAAEHTVSAKNRYVGVPPARVTMCGRATVQGVGAFSAGQMPSILVTESGEALHAVPVLLCDRGPRQ